MVVGTCVLSVIRRNIGRQRAWQGLWMGGFCKINIHDVSQLFVTNTLIICKKCWNISNLFHYPRSNQSLNQQNTEKEITGSVETFNNLPCSFPPESWSHKTLMSPLFHSSSQKYHFDFGETHESFLLLTPLNTPRSFITLLILHWPFFSL